MSVFLSKTFHSFPLLTVHYCVHLTLLTLCVCVCVGTGVSLFYRSFLFGVSSVQARRITVVVKDGEPEATTTPSLKGHHTSFAATLLL